MANIISIDKGGKGRELRYLALRLAGLDLKLAAHASSLGSMAAATALESLLPGNLERKLRAQLDLPREGRGRGALRRRLRLQDARVLAARLLALPPPELHQLAETLRPDPKRRRRGKRRGFSPTPIAHLGSQLRQLAATLPLDFALLVQFRDGCYRHEDLARLQLIPARVVIGAPVRRLGDRPRVSVVPAASPGNRVQHGRLTAYVRCMLAAAQLIQSTN